MPSRLQTATIIQRPSCGTWAGRASAAFRSVITIRLRTSRHSSEPSGRSHEEDAVSKTIWERRDFLKAFLAGLPLMSLDWESFPRGKDETRSGNEYDAVVIGAGLGGLSCAAAFARQGFKPLVIEQHDKVGGFATAFSRPGGLTLEVSLHSTTVGQRDGAFN